MSHHSNWLTAFQQEVITAPPTYPNLRNLTVLLVLKLTCLYSKTFYLNIFENIFIVNYGSQNFGYHCKQHPDKASAFISLENSK